MSEKATKTPQIRFDGYTDAWEQRKLDNLATFSKGSGYSKGDLVEEGSPIILYGRLYTKYETLIKDVDTFVLPKGHSVISEGNEVIVPASGETSEDISRAAVVDKSGILLGGDLNIIKPKSKLNSVFLALTISNGSQQKELSKRAQGNSVVHLYNSELKKVNLYFPSLEEQEKIGSFFIQLDHLITLHQRECDLLAKMKKSYLQKMFPKNGEDKPEIRFDGYTDAWEQRKLTEIVNRVNKSSNSDVLPKVEFEDIVSGEGRLNKDISSKFDSRKGTLFEPENILYGKLRPYLKNWLFSDFEGVALGDFWVFEATDVSVPSFDYYLIQSDNYQKVANDTSGTKMPRSDWKNVSSTDFAIPSKDEQKQIGAFFKQLDNTIVLHQRELDSLKKMKKSLLQMMFV
ncbi:hypothetical protein AU077_03820 [Streptococcus gallolyticus]|uniref:restriction endonuclease subunit S n=1 Tax=Streptococcus gallolyticus TaxID=315405 RepID=UPI000733C255|nr:restriction endonuclease subunit S [Streptococcus gallolyticus]ALT80743.1 hypothetical protein AU077_03820 [Streptococcus gallolyticus]